MYFFVTFRLSFELSSNNNPYNFDVLCCVGSAVLQG